VLEALTTVCFLKSEHVSVHWQDRTSPRRGKPAPSCWIRQPGRPEGFEADRSPCRFRPA
jgi:hypothetical protein